MPSTFTGARSGGCQPERLCAVRQLLPHLVAGLIVRARLFLPHCKTPRSASKDQLGWGMALLVIGLFAKVVMADGLLAPVVNQVYAAPGNFSALDG